jgi:hypothetical protein
VTFHPAAFYLLNAGVIGLCYCLVAWFMGYWDAGVLGCWGAGVLGCWVKSPRALFMLSRHSTHTHTHTERERERERGRENELWRIFKKTNMKQIKLIKSVRSIQNICWIIRK